MIVKENAVEDRFFFGSNSKTTANKRISAKRVEVDFPQGVTRHLPLHHWHFAEKSDIKEVQGWSLFTYRATNTLILSKDPKVRNRSDIDENPIFHLSLSFTSTWQTFTIKQSQVGTNLLARQIEQNVWNGD